MTRDLWIRRNRVQAKFILAHRYGFHPDTVGFANRFLELYGGTS